jgi:hypothetical protein
MLDDIDIISCCHFIIFDIYWHACIDWYAIDAIITDADIAPVSSAASFRALIASSYFDIDYFHYIEYWHCFDITLFIDTTFSIDTVITHGAYFM